MSLPARMRLIDHGSGGGPEVLQIIDAEVPEIGAGEVLIAVEVAGVNRPDVAQRAGSYPPPKGASPHLGLEVSGRIAAVGQGVTEWRVGDAVCALVNGGGYAEYVSAPAGQVLPRLLYTYDAADHLTPLNIGRILDMLRQTKM